MNIIDFALNILPAFLGAEIFKYCSDATTTSGLFTAVTGCGIAQKLRGLNSARQAFKIVGLSLRSESHSFSKRATRTGPEPKIWDKRQASQFKSRAPACIFEASFSTSLTTVIM